MAVVTFDYAGWQGRYPEFASVTLATAQAYFNEAAALYCDNSDSSPIQDATKRGLMLNQLVSHLAALNNTQLVGRVTAATEGSVSVSVDPGITTGSAAWYQQTKYGAAFWQASKPYRMFRYQPGASCLR